MEVTATRLLQSPVDHHFGHVDVEVTIDGHRLLTLETHDAGTAATWLFDSARRPNTRHDGYVVSMAVEREFVTYDRNGLADEPLDLLECCVGSHCLVFHLPDPEKLKPRCYDRFDPTSLRNFFDHKRVTVVGVNMRYVAEKLDRDYGVKIMNWFDLNELAVRAMGREDLDLARYGLDRLARTVLGKRWDVVRDDDDDEPPEDWYECKVLEEGYYHYDLPLSLQKIKSVTVDTYLSFMTGTKLLEMLRSTGTTPPPKDLMAASTSSVKKKVKEKRERNGSAGGKNNKR